jgi:hypothetical protein
VIGDEVKRVSGPRLPVAAPVADHIKLFRNGGVIGRVSQTIRFGKAGWPYHYPHFSPWIEARIFKVFWKSRVFLGSRGAGCL